MRPVRVKVCCISSPAEARLAVRHGASALGLVSAMPSGPGVISEELIAAIAATIPPGIASFLLTSQTAVSEIVEQQHRCGCGVLQLCDHLPGTEHRQLRRALPGIGLVQVIHVSGPESLDEARALGPEVDAVLLDSGRPSAAVKELGGTGRTHDWQLSRAIRNALLPRPIYLAGGLRPDNVEEAVTRVRPFGVDLCSGVRREGDLDEELLSAFFAAVRRGEAAL